MNTGWKLGGYLCNISYEVRIFCCNRGVVFSLNTEAYVRKSSRFHEFYLCLTILKYIPLYFIFLTISLF